MASAMSASFDETDFESLYFQGVNLEDAKNILMEEEEGTFLIRDSSRGGYVICIKENGEVSQYTVQVRERNGQTNFFVREEFPFTNFSSLLSFYKLNKFKTASLQRPVSSDRVILRRCQKEGCDRGHIRSEYPINHQLPTSNNATSSLSAMRKSAPPDMSKPYESTSNALSANHPPLYARVVRAREASPYTKDLTLRPGDIIRVTGKSNKEGKCTGELNGTVGEFPLVNVELIKK